jgi:hypothetical protein
LSKAQLAEMISSRRKLYSASVRSFLTSAVIELDGLEEARQPANPITAPPSSPAASSLGPAPASNFRTNKDAFMRMHSKAPKQGNKRPVCLSNEDDEFAEELESQHSARIRIPASEGSRSQSSRSQEEDGGEVFPY